MSAREARAPLAAAGSLLISVAVLHAVVGAWFGRRLLQAMLLDGIVNTVASHPERGVVFWFLVMSPLLLMLGQLCLFLAERGIAPPRWLGIEVLALTVCTALLMPVSGFWLLIPPAVLLVRASVARPE